MKAIKPPPFKSEAIFKRIDGASQRTADLADTEFAKTYKTWEHQPLFRKKLRSSREGVAWEVFTYDQIYVWLNNGTKGPYKIPKAGPGLLAFPSGYKAKTVPKLVYSRSGGPFGPTVFVSGQVTHPGIEPREFDKAVAQYVNPWWVKWMADAIKVGARESGHSI